MTTVRHFPGGDGIPNMGSMGVSDEDERRIFGDDEETTIWWDEHSPVSLVEQAMLATSKTLVDAACFQLVIDRNEIDWKSSLPPREVWRQTYSTMRYQRSMYVSGLESAAGWDPNP